MTRVHFPSLVGLRLRAFGAQPPSELMESNIIIANKLNKPILNPGQCK